MKKRLLILVCSFGMLVSASAQDGDYKSAIGGRVGPSYSSFDIAGSYKFFITKPGAIELNVGVRPYTYSHSALDLTFSASYQHHFPIGNVEGLKWFVGGGLSPVLGVGDYYDYYDRKRFGLEIFPTGGADYKFGNIPLNVSVDFRPTIALNDRYGRSFYPSAGASVRYTLN